MTGGSQRGPGKWVRCTFCFGHGIVASHHDPHVPDDCPACHGHGHFWRKGPYVTLYPGGRFATVFEANHAARE